MLIKWRRLEAQHLSNTSNQHQALSWTAAQTWEFSHKYLGHPWEKEEKRIWEQTSKSGIGVLYDTIAQYYFLTVVVVERPYFCSIN